MQCSRCIMDSKNDPDLKLNRFEVCNHCEKYEESLKFLISNYEHPERFQNLIKQIKSSANTKYNCVIGISGGVDSTYLAYIAKVNGLKPLLVHCDNGWNSELAVQNINNICKYTGFDLETLVLDWEEFKDIQLSFFKANVVDLELPYDYALMITVYKAALKYNIQYVLTGHNIATEGTYMPKSWRHTKMDIVNIKDIHKKFGKRKMKSFPHFSFVRQRFVDSKLTYLSPLNLIKLTQKEMKEVIAREFDWRDYGGKHYENVFTRFYQGYILKEKFKINKKVFHLSVLVQSNQITREEALKRLPVNDYPTELLEADKLYVVKKLDMTLEEFEDYMKQPAVPHENYKSINKYWENYFAVVRKLKPIMFWRN